MAADSLLGHGLRLTLNRPLGGKVGLIFPVFLRYTIAVFSQKNVNGK